MSDKPMSAVPACDCPATNDGLSPNSWVAHKLGCSKYMDPTQPEQTQRCPVCLSDSRKYGNMRPCADAWHTEREYLGSPAQPDCLCRHAIENFDGIHHDRRCRLYVEQPEQTVVNVPIPEEQEGAPDTVWNKETEGDS